MGGTRSIFPVHVVGDVCSSGIIRSINGGAMNKRKFLLTMTGGSDTTAPTCVITADASGITAGAFTATVTFSKAVTGFVVGDITQKQGGASSNILSAFSGSGSVYTCTVTPDAVGTVTLEVGAGVCEDGAGNSNEASNTFSVVYITIASFWNHDEASGTRVDAVGSRDMLVVGTVTSDTGKIGAASVISGTGNRLNSTDAGITSLDWASGFSVWGWLYVPTTYTGRNTILGKASNTVADWVLYTNAANQLRFIVIDSVSGLSTAENTTTLSVDTWYFLAGRYNPSTKKAEFSLNAGTWSLGAALTNVPRNIETRLDIASYIGLYGNARYDINGFSMNYLPDEAFTALYNGGAGRAIPF